MPGRCRALRERFENTMTRRTSSEPTPATASPAMSLLGAVGSPFNLGNAAAYGDWRQAKLEGYPQRVEDLMVPVANLAHPTDAEVSAIAAQCTKTNMAIYRLNGTLATGDAVKALGGRLGLHRLDLNPSSGDDGLTAIAAVGGVPGRDYIPHTDKPLNWHTDGYYNPPNRRVHAMTLHCVRAASEGGANTLLDPEIVYIRLRDQNPDHIAALMDPEAMIIPANVQDGREIRPAQSGPVFSITPETGTLHTRYTARSRSIEWRKDPATAAAVQALESLLAEPGRHTFRYQLSPGEGLICNNVFHRRDGFRDPPAPQPGRLVLRGRYYDRVAVENREK